MPLDTQLLLLLNSLAGQSPFQDGVIVFFAQYLAYLLAALFVVLVAVSGYSRRQKLEALVVAGLAAGIARLGVAELIRFFYPRQRPYDYDALSTQVYNLFTNGGSSFPSGHATFFFALSTVVYLYHRKWGITFFVASILITVSRVAAGVHYPSDILGGALIGVIVGYLTVFFARKWLVSRPDCTY
jgi:undecaprenyl-diphosphatase